MSEMAWNDELPDGGEGELPGEDSGLTEEMREFLTEFGWKGEKEWEWSPDSIDCMEANFYYCDDCETWHQDWQGTGIMLMDGEVWTLDAECDRDGNWDMSSGVRVSTPDEWETEAKRCTDDCSKSYTDYLKYVAETGDDPTCESSVRTVRTYTRKYQVIAAGRIVGAVVYYWRRLRGEWKQVAEMPKSLQDYLGIGPYHRGCVGVVGSAYEGQEFMTWTAFKELGLRWQRSSPSDPFQGRKFLVEVEEKVERKKSIVRRILRLWARKSLREIERRGI